MGKASKWFRGLFGPNKRRWSLLKSYTHKETQPQPQPQPHPHPHQNDTDKHAVAVAVATAAAAEAAVVAAKAAAAVVRLTSRKNPPAHVSRAGAAHVRGDEVWAAVRIQSAFRGSLARKALRALKGLVKLQALVRGHIERKRTAEWLHRMQVMMQAQARAIVGRSEIAKPNNPFVIHPGPSTPEKVEHVIRSRSRKCDQSSLLRKNSSKKSMSDDHDHKANLYNITQFDEKSGNLRSYSARNASNDDEKNDKIVEVDTSTKHPPHHIIVTPKRRNLFLRSNDQNSQSSTAHSSYEVLLTPLKLSEEKDNVGPEEVNSPQFHSATSSRRTPFTPSKSDGSMSFFSDYCPSYMSCTESSKAKARSMSAPKQRPQAQYERSGSTKRYSINGVGDSRQKISALHSNFVNKAYPGSGRLDKLGMPIGYRY